MQKRFGDGVKKGQPGFCGLPSYLKAKLYLFQLKTRSLYIAAVGSNHYVELAGFVKEITVMSFENYFPLWNDLNTAQKKVISDNLITRDVKKGTIIHNGNLDCTGLLLVKSGQLRTYILSDEGREITLYRLFDMDMCLLSASCIIRSIQFEVTIEAEEDTDLWIIPAEIYKEIGRASCRERV